MNSPLEHREHNLSFCGGLDWQAEKSYSACLRGVVSDKRGKMLKPLLPQKATKTSSFSSLLSHEQQGL